MWWNVVRYFFAVWDWWRVNVDDSRMIHPETIARFFWHLLDVRISSSRNTSHLVQVYFKHCSENPAWLLLCYLLYIIKVIVFDICYRVCVWRSDCWERSTVIVTNVPLAKDSRNCLSESSLFLSISNEHFALISSLLVSVFCCDMNYISSVFSL